MIKSKSHTKPAISLISRDHSFRTTWMSLNSITLMTKTNFRYSDSANQSRPLSKICICCNFHMPLTIFLSNLSINFHLIFWIVILMNGRTSHINPEGLSCGLSGFQIYELKPVSEEWCRPPEYEIWSVLNLYEVLPLTSEGTTSLSCCPAQSTE
jgi:hypothetical protein